MFLVCNNRLSFWHFQVRRETIKIIARQNLLIKFAQAHNTFKFSVLSFHFSVYFSYLCPKLRKN